MISRSESMVTMPVVNPSSSGTSRTFRFAGKLDLLRGGRLIDWKTVTDPHDFIQKQTVGCQGELYALALEYEGVKVNSIVYRLLQKPTIKLCGKDKTPHDYEERCVDWLLKSPGAVMEHEMFFNPSRLAAARQKLWDVSKRIIECRANERWLHNENACKTWQRACEYLPICMSECQGMDTDYVIKNQYEQGLCHEELEGVKGVNGFEKDLLTYSSISTFCICERRYFRRYECALRPKQDETSDALYVGSATHAGLDAYVKNGLESALVAISEWADFNPVIGECAAHRQDQHIAQARAIVRVAAQAFGLDGGTETA